MPRHRRRSDAAACRVAPFAQLFKGLQMKVRFALKSATDEIHQALDERLSRLNLSDRQDYVRFLGFHGCSLPAIEAVLMSSGLDAVLPDWSSHRRSPAIAADLADLGETMPAHITPPVFSGTPAMLGAAYVLEGSRLGGRVLQRRLGAGLPGRFLSQSESLDPWIDVIAALDRLLYSDELIGEAADAARRCFALFVHAADEVGIQ